MAIAVIGAGPAGLAVSASLSARGVKHRLLEQGDRVGGAYTRLHPELELGSPPRMLSLPLTPGPWPRGMRAPLVKMGEYLRYLEDYARAHQIAPEFGSPVQRVEPLGEGRGGYRVHLGTGEAFEASAVVCATGMVSFPRLVEGDFPAEAAKRETAVAFRGREGYRGQRVLVVGTGFSATEIATQLARGSAAEVHLLVKPHFFLLKPRIAGLSIHYFLSFIELFPAFFFRHYCESRYHDPALDFGFSAAVGSGRIRVHRDPAEARAAAPYDVGIEAVGYRFETAYLPAAVERRADGSIRTSANESVSHPGIFVIGHPCAGGRSNSKLLRGISRESWRLAKRLQKI